MNKNIIAYAWFCGTICIMIAEFEHEGPKALIKNTSGMNEVADLQDCYDWGSKFPMEEALSLCKNYGNIVQRDKFSVNLQHENSTR